MEVNDPLILHSLCTCSSYHKRQQIFSCVLGLLS